MHSSISVEKREHGGFFYTCIMYTVYCYYMREMRDRERVCTCAGVRNAGDHIGIVQSITKKAGAVVRSNWICTVAIRSTDSSIFYTFINICQNTDIKKYIRHDRNHTHKYLVFFALPTSNIGGWGWHASCRFSITFPISWRHNTGKLYSWSCGEG